MTTFFSKHNSLSSADKLLHPSITVKKPENAYNEDNEKEKAINPEKAVKVISKPLVMPTNEDDDEDNFADVADDDDENGAEMLLQDDAKWQVILASVFVLVFWTVVIAIAYMMAATDVCWKVKVQREWQENSLEMGHIA